MSWCDDDTDLRLTRRTTPVAVGETITLELDGEGVARARIVVAMGRRRYRGRQRGVISRTHSNTLQGL
jgi:hypothetical protein